MKIVWRRHCDQLWWRVLVQITAEDGIFWHRAQFAAYYGIRSQVTRDEFVRGASFVTFTGAQSRYFSTSFTTLGPMPETTAERFEERVNPRQMADAVLSVTDKVIDDRCRALRLNTESDSGDVGSSPGRRERWMIPATEYWQRVVEQQIQRRGRNT